MRRSIGATRWPSGSAAGSGSAQPSQQRASAPGIRTTRVRWWFCAATVTPVQSVRPRDPLQPSSILTFRSIPSALSRIRAHRPIAPQRGIRKCPLCGPTKATILELSRDWLFLPLRGTAAHDATNDSSAHIESRRTAVHDFVAHTKLHGPAQGNHATQWHRATRLLGLPLIRRQIYCPVCRYSPAPCLCRAPRRSRDRRRRRPASRFLP